MNHIHLWEQRNDRTILALHGTGGDEHSLAGLAHALDPDASILSVRGNVLEGAAPRFFRRLSEGVFDLADLIQRTNDLADFIADVSDRYGFDQAGVVALGYSNGANIAASLLLMRPESLGAAILLRAMMPLAPRSLPNLAGKPVLLVSGDSDPILPIASARALADALLQSGANVTFEVLPTGHGLSRNDLQLAQAWLQAL